MVEKDYNFNRPVEVVEIFRTEVGRKLEEFDEEEPRNSPINVKLEEHSRISYFLWENLEEVDSYAYNDDWTKFKGEKYTITLRGHPPKLILGNYKNMVAYWTMFRQQYPIFVERQEHDTVQRIDNIQNDTES